MTKKKPTTRPVTKSKVDPVRAFALYVALGPERSINALHKALANQGEAVSRNTLMKWAAENGWEEAAQAQLTADTVTLGRLSKEVASAAARQEATGPIPFSAAETLEATANALQAMTCGLANVVTQQAHRLMNTTIDFSELIVLAKTVGEVSAAVATLHKAVNGEPAKPNPKDITPSAGGEGRPDDYGPPGMDGLEAVFINPPMTRPAPR